MNYAGPMNQNQGQRRYPVIKTTTLYEPAQDKGWGAIGSGNFCLDAATARGYSKDMYQDKATKSMEHIAVELGGAYYLLKQADPIKLWHGEVSKVQKVAEFMAGIPRGQLDILGMTKEELARRLM